MIMSRTPDFGRPKPWGPPDDEDPRVTAKRVDNAARERAWLVQYASDTTISDLDFMAASAHLGYALARELAALSVQIMEEKGEWPR